MAKNISSRLSRSGLLKSRNMARETLSRGGCVHQEAMAVDLGKFTVSGLRGKKEGIGKRLSATWGCWGCPFPTNRAAS